MKKCLALLLCLCMFFTAGCAKTGVPKESSAPAAEAGEPADATGKDVLIVTDQNVWTYDEWADNGMSNGMLAKETVNWISDTLVRFGEDGNYYPNLATEWELSEDGLTLTLALRDDVVFSNGDPLTAEDVAYTINRTKAENVSKSKASLWYSYLDYAEAIDGTTVVVHYTMYSPVLFSGLYYLGIIVNKAEYEKVGESYWTNPVTCGAFKITSFDTVNTILEFERNELWWGWTANDSWWKENMGTGNIDSITVKYVAESTTRAAAVRSGEAIAAENISADEISGLISDGDQIYSYDRTDHMMLQTACGPENLFYDKNLREALSLCIDRKLIVDTILSGYSSVCEWPCNPGGVGSGYVEGRGYEYNPEKAAQLVSESDYDGSPIDFLCNTAKVAKGTEVALAIESMASEVGLNLKIRVEEDAVFSADRRARNFDVVLTSHVGNNNEWYNDIVRFMHNDEFNTGWEDKVMYDLCEVVMYDAIGLEAQQKAREAVYERAMEMFQPSIYLYLSPGIHGFSDKVDINTLTFHSNSCIDYRFAQIAD